ncbi:hypothetical protein F4819DRAFT_477486 [Hypoxylon fuscum]|nr:hypothetical protein F4819DRAFT_477486 [Hypoxylon fuscum]
MEPLRRQLGEAQGALHEKTTQFRKLKVAHAAALEEKQSFETKLQQLEAENLRLRQSSGAVGGAAQEGSGSPDSIIMGEGMSNVPVAQTGNEETFVITRTQWLNADSKYRRVKNELEEKNRLCETLQRQLQVRAPAPMDLTEDQVVACWKKLRDQIRDLSLRKFNKLKLVSDTGRQEFEQLSTRWKTYMTNEKLTCYIVRALVWRYIDTGLFQKYCRVWGREYGGVATRLSDIFAPTVSDAELQGWRMHTAAMFHIACEPDATIQNELVTKVFDAIMQVAASNEAETIKKALAEIVGTAAELSTIFARSTFMPLFSNAPGSNLIRGFPFREEIMELKGKLGDGKDVDIMVSPCLLNTEADYSVLMKAEVIC